MQKKWLGLIGGLVGILVVSAVVIPVTIYFVRKNQKTEDFDIRIISDDHFADYNFLGNGSKNSPYLIVNYTIDTSFKYGIYIRDTTKYFVIQNCYVQSKEIGIYIENIAFDTAKIVNCTSNGIMLYLAPSTELVANKVSSIGIYMDRCSKSSCIENTASYSGIFIVNSEEILVTDNFCFNNSIAGIHLNNASNSILTNNYCYNNTYSEMSVYYSSNITIMNNYCWKNPAIWGCSCGLTLYSTFNVIVQNNTFSNNAYGGIIIEESQKVEVFNNSCIGTEESGIDLYHAYNCTIFENICTENSNCGIDLDYSSDNILINNTCSYNYRGIDGSASRSTFLNNTFNFNFC